MGRKAGCQLISSRSTLMMSSRGRVPRALLCPPVLRRVRMVSLHRQCTTQALIRIIIIIIAVQSSPCMYNISTELMVKKGNRSRSTSPGGRRSPRTNNELTRERSTSPELSRRSRAISHSKMDPHADQRKAAAAAHKVLSPEPSNNAPTNSCEYQYYHTGVCHMILSHPQL